MAAILRCVNRPCRRRAIPALFPAVVALLLGLTGTAPAAFNPSATEAPLGDFLLWQSETSGFVPPEPADPSREIGVWVYDGASAVPVYARQNPWTYYDPYGLWGFHSSNGRLLDGLWNHVVTPAAQVTGGAVVGYGEVVIPEPLQSSNARANHNTPLGSTAADLGRAVGRAAGTAQGAVEVVQGAALAAAGATVDATGAVAVPFTGGGSAVLEVPGTVALAGGAIEAGHGAICVYQGIKLGPVPRGSYNSESSSSPSGKSAKGQSETNASSRGGSKLTKEQIQKETGSYTNTHASGKTYSGKGSRARSQASGRREAARNNDPHTATDWTPSNTHRDAFKDESRRLDANGGAKIDTNYNRIEQPGKKYRQQDGDD